MTHDDQHDAHETHGSRLQRDKEIRALQRQARESLVGIQAPPQVPPAPPRRALLIVGGALGLLLLAGACSVAAKAVHNRTLARETERDAVPTVAVVNPALEKPEEDLVLPASLKAFEESPIYARTNGYLLRWTRDIGSHVAKGELLAELDTPEVDRELDQARASRKQAEAQAQIARITAERWATLVKTHDVSAQEADQQESGYQQALANLAAADANVRRLEQLEGFKKVYAPFAGVLTKRNVDPGALINAGSGEAGKELFDLAQVSPLRVFCSVPQPYAPFLKPGSRAAVTLQEFPGKTFVGTIARTAEAIDPATRTLLTEVDLPNKDGQLLSGSFGLVHFKTGTPVDRVTIPVNALLFRREGPSAAVVGEDGKVSLRPIAIGRDYGTSLEVVSGLAPTDRIVINPSDSLEDGQSVKAERLDPAK
jgi:membrane fusion protein, multidrug efflux system